MSTMSFTKTVLKNLFHKPVTRPYPKQPRVYPERTRGHVVVDMESCILCGLCARKCPTGAIAVNRAERTWAIERFDCIQCACCTYNCPKHSLSMEPEYTAPDTEKHGDIYQKED